MAILQYGLTLATEPGEIVAAVSIVALLFILLGQIFKALDGKKRK